ncbi:MAG: hypothetical protein JW703_01070 [Candidatus Diapherotrites archaeon]|nr:hypothetical protein [Candidatus Diapherotrites archaeon]
MFDSSKNTSRTEQEQSLLHAIEALKSELASETSETRHNEIESQIKELGIQLEELSSPVKKVSLSEENIELKHKIEELNKKIIKLENEAINSVNGQQKLDKRNIEEKMFLLYFILLQKYASIVNDFEKKTVGELKSLINAEDLSIISLAESFKKEDYSFESDYFDACRNAFEYVRDEIDFVKAKLNINFWLTPNEIMKYRLGDDEDQAVFLCSLLLVLGDKKAEVVIAEMDDLSSHAFVITEINEKFFLLDATQNKDFEEFSGDKKEVLIKYSFKNTKIKKFLYRFNNEKYEQFI